MQKIIYIIVLIFLPFSILYASSEVRDEVLSEPDLNIQTLVDKPSTFDGEKVTVEGQINSKVKYKTLANGKEYTAFKIEDSYNNELNVYTKGHIDGIEKGSKIRIYGKFSKEKKFLFIKFKNVIKAKKLLVLQT